MRKWIHAHARSALTVGGPVLALALIAALAWEAVAAARAQRETVEAVLRDYAEIAAEQYAGGVAMALDYGWFFPVLRGMTETDVGLRVPGPEFEIRTQMGSHRMSVLATRFFRARLDSGEVVGAAGWPAPLADAGMRALLQEHAPTAAAEGWPVAAVVHEGGGADRLIVFQAVQQSAPEHLVVKGFDAPLAGFVAVLGPVLSADRVLPTSLTDTTGVELVSVRVVSAGGRLLYESGPKFDPTFTATTQLGARLGGIQVQAAIPPASAEHLVIGGLPRSRLPIIAAMLVAAVAMLAGGILLVRREHELVRLRERFVAGASHELRTPLAQIRMFAETLRLDRVRSAAERDRSLEILDREARRLSYLVENLLHFSRPQEHKVRSSPERIELGALAAEVVEGFAPLAAARNARLQIVEHGPATALIDRDAMRQVLLNMLDNATKYGPPGQTITVTVGREGERVVLSVDDEGPGVPPGDRARIWGRFWRGPDTGGTTGTGIGLSLVKELVESNAGEVLVADAPGGGARFQVIVPGAQ